MIKDEKDNKNNDASIYIQDNNVTIYLNLKKKNWYHKPIIYSLRDSVIQ